MANLLFPEMVFEEENKESEIAEKRKKIDMLLNSLKEKNKINLREAMNRNIIFVGKTRSGKSTSLSVMKDPFKFVKKSSLFSETIDARINHFTVEVATADGSKVNFNLGIIDTPGLFEVRNEGTSRDNDALEDIVLKCMNAEITKINGIFFVVAYGSSGINPQDIAALHRFITLFKGAQDHVQVLVTHAEKLSDAEKQKIESEFRSYPGMAELLKLVNPKMYFIGAMDAGDYENGFVDSFNLVMPNILKMRQILYMDIFRKDSYFELKMLSMMDGVRNKADKLYDDLKKQHDSKDIKSVELFKSECRKLGTMLPLLDPLKYEEANQFLLKCESLGK